MQIKYTGFNQPKILLMIKNGWKKLNDYYTRIDETPLYYAAIALHPEMKMRYFEDEWVSKPTWLAAAKRLVTEL